MENSKKALDIYTKMRHNHKHKGYTKIKKEHKNENKSPLQWH